MKSEAAEVRSEAALEGAIMATRVLGWVVALAAATGCSAAPALLGPDAARALVVHADRAADREDNAEAVRAYLQCVETCPGPEGQLVIADLSAQLRARPDLAELLWQAVDRMEAKVVAGEGGWEQLHQTVSRLVRIYATHAATERPRALLRRLWERGAAEGYATLLTACAIELPASLRELSTHDVELLVERAAGPDRTGDDGAPPEERGERPLASGPQQAKRRRAEHAIKIASFLLDAERAPAAERVMRAAIFETGCETVMDWLAKEESPTLALACSACPSARACLPPGQSPPRPKSWVCRGSGPDLPP